MKLNFIFPLGYILYMPPLSNETKEALTVGRLLISGKFHIRRLPEAYVLAQFIAESCPKPRLIVVGLTEMFLNAIEHGNLGIDFEEKSKIQEQENWMEEIDRRLNLPENIHKFVEVDYTRTKEEIIIKVRDQGNGFDYRSYEHFDFKEKASLHGRGILLAKSLIFKSVEYSENGSEVTCVISLKE